MKFLILIIIGFSLQACVVKTAVGVAGNVAEGAVKTTGAGVDAVDDDEDEE